MRKYQEYYKRMINANKEAFDNFRLIHDKYILDPEKYQENLNVEGEKIMTIVRDWENKLCMQSEKGGYGVFTSKLSEKFMNEVRNDYPKIDSVGIIIKDQNNKDKTQNPFSLKKINLS